MEKKYSAVHSLLQVTLLKFSCDLRGSALGECERKKNQGAQLNLGT